MHFVSGRLRRRQVFFGLMLALGIHTAALAQADSAPRKGKATVLLSITVNTPQISVFTSVSVNREPTGGQKGWDHFELLPVARGMARDTMLFSGNLPAGTYEVTRLDQSISRKQVSLNEISRKIIGRFVVGEGQSIDLGRLVVTPVNDRVIVGRARRMPVSNSELLRRYELAQAAVFLSQTPVPGWAGGSDEEDIAESYALNHPVGLQSPFETADGRVLVASRMGSVLMRNREGRWAALRSERLDSVLYVMPVERPDAKLLAVGELGLLLRQQPGYRDLQTVDTGDLPPGNLSFIAGNDKVGWYVALQNGKTLRVMRSARLEAGEWKPVRELDVSAAFNGGPATAWFWPTANGFAYATVRSQVHVLDFATGQWSERFGPMRLPLLDVVANPDGSVSAMTVSSSGLSGEYALLFNSRDDGANWQPVLPEIKQRLGAPAALRDGTLLVVGGSYEKPLLHASSDGGKTWTPRAIADPNATLRCLPSGLVLSIGGARFGWMSLDSSKDGGLSWQSEYSTFDRAAYKAEKEQQQQQQQQQKSP